MGNSPPEPHRTDGSENPQSRAPQYNEKIRRLKAKSSHGLYVMALFIALSIGAIRDFDFLPSFSTKVHDLLGQPPSAEMISTALLIYSFSAIILVLSRMMSGSGKSGGFIQVAYLAGFYFFYHFAGAMEENFWAVFAAGMTILGLESYQVWTWCREEIRIEGEILAVHERNKHKDDKPGD
jgi:hypothetical protein